MPDDYPTKAFPSAKAFSKWLENNHANAKGLWVRFYKKASGKKTVTYAEAVLEALCYGWIDGQAKRLDEDSYLQRFTPRRARSLWSEINTKHAARLIKEKRMKPAGLAQVQAAKKDGRWKAAYSPPSTAKPPKDFLDALSKFKEAEAFFSTLNRSNVFAIVYQLQTAKKPETRQRRLDKILDMMKRKQKWHP